MTRIQDKVAKLETRSSFTNDMLLLTKFTHDVNTLLEWKKVRHFRSIHATDFANNIPTS